MFLPLSLLLSAIFLVGCAPPELFGKKRRSHKTEQTAKTTTVTIKFEKPISTCQQRYREYEDGSYSLYIEKQITIPMHREKQRTLRYSCEGVLYKDKVETIIAPTERFELIPAQRMSSVNSVQLFNLESCATAAADLGIMKVIGNKIIALNEVRGYQSGRISIRGDESPGYFNFLMNKGLNRIYYTYFTDCTAAEIKGAALIHVPSCEKTSRKYSGIFNVYVDYTETIRPGYREIKDSCPKPQQEKQ